MPTPHLTLSLPLHPSSWLFCSLLTKKKQANGIFAFGVYVGGGLSSLSIAMAQGIGWRASAYTVAAYGFVLAVLVRVTVKEPVRAPAAAPANDHADEESEGDKDYTVKER